MAHKKWCMFVFIVYVYTSVHSYRNTPLKIDWQCFQGLGPVFICLSFCLSSKSLSVTFLMCCVCVCMSAIYMFVSMLMCVHIVLCACVCKAEWVTFAALPPASVLLIAVWWTKAKQICNGWRHLDLCRPSQPPQHTTLISPVRHAARPCVCLCVRKKWRKKDWKKFLYSVSFFINSTFYKFPKKHNMCLGVFSAPIPCSWWLNFYNLPLYTTTMEIGSHYVIKVYILGFNSRGFTKALTILEWQQSL